ncbi:Ig-like domain-containing protein [Desulfurivibrio dismutans]|uniref:Ig-like domain-containing protein n=1 Tax=Desulfurivibrio dismutans TaxID=1398908 RepID=UPI0023DB271A|nr:Ig-like domain-containing protein [Desulfurivibrio alkaliphilus]MDF1613976.1 Ig-like domain-containing protein [Desulfurivibrio alkaliphilus]
MANDKDVNDFGDIDDWLADLDDDEQGQTASVATAELDSDELDQSDIDQLLSGGGTEDGGAQADSVELDQNDIDSLFGDAPQEVPEPTPVAEQEAGAGEGGDDFEDLFAGDSGEDSAEQPEAGSPELAESPEASESLEAPPATEEEASVEVGTEEVAGDDELPVAEEQPAVAEREASTGGGGEEEKDPFAFDDGEFDIEGFDFDDDIPDIPDENMLESSREGKQETADEDIFADTPSAAEPASEDEEEATVGENWKKGFVAWLPASFDKSAINKSTIGASLFSLLVLIGAAYFLLGRDGEPELAIPPQVREELVEALEPEPTDLAEPPAPIMPPVARDERFRMDQPGAAVSMQLRAEAPDGGPLAYEIVTPPRYGRLSGEPPRVTYLPNPDFPGEDRFVFRATDGRQASEPARVAIVGPSLRAADKEAPLEEVEEVLTMTPEQPLIRVRDLVMTSRSTEPLKIDWAAVWRRDNTTPFTGVRVEIMQQDLQEGRLRRLDPATHIYEPDPYFQGEESLVYRFHYAGQRSKPRRLTLRVESGHPPPSVRLGPLAATYPPGETVLLDARETLAVRPQELRFEWRQLSGSAVHLESLADNDALVRFVAPSPFAHVASPKVVLQVTAMDPAGRRDTKTVEINTPSRRQSALWRGEEDAGQQRNSPLWGF